MEQHSDIVVKNIPYGGAGDKEQLARELRDAVKLAVENLELNAELVMVDIQENTSRRAETCHAFLCFENYWQHKRIAEQFTGMVTIRRKNPSIELSHNRAYHGPEYIRRTWVKPSYRPFRPKKVKSEFENSPDSKRKASPEKRSTLSSSLITTPNSTVTTDISSVQLKQESTIINDTYDEVEELKEKLKKVEKELSDLKYDADVKQRRDAMELNEVKKVDKKLREQMEKEIKKLKDENKQLKTTLATISSIIKKVKLS